MTVQEITVLSKPSCVQCTATYRALDNAGIVYKVIDLTKDDAALTKMKELGFMQAPVVLTDTDSWSGFQPGKIQELKALIAA